MFKQLTTILWVSFAALLTFGALRMLDACAMLLSCLPNWNFCPVEPDRRALDAAMARGQMLKLQISQLELGIAKLPVCPVAGQPPSPSPPPPPAPPPPPPPPLPPPPPPPIEPKSNKELTIAPGEGTAELEGCWQSTTPTLHRVQDGKRLGTITYTYCFDAGGQTGHMRIVDDHGVTCEAPTRAEVAGSVLKIHQDKAMCSDGIAFNPGEITCQIANNAPAICDIVDIDNGVPEPRDEQIIGERFHRAP